ncbi:hypothetical protein [Janthinobacterium sp. 1_2014MBL_MicDiv]|uniref:hypothetical protein n=1 Tax=Janthinobacterium sp. 1_2014MBL_MicDiv TaxID=1644131 RepID=UPI0008F4C6EB|nr:hypothetical protein [Janthinobacterium sp. 1_2014MBL_MicDiv]APA68539.1 hypothetical protein YQ44_12765 [Janthinobacterium sp. 1_2014MBL_MicDiv]
MDTISRRYLAWFFTVAFFVLALVSAMNYRIDPYLLHQWDTPLLQRLRPTNEKLSAWGKTYAVARYRPSIIYIGNSRTEMGLPTRAQATFPDKSVFNSAVSGASLGDAIRLAEHAAKVSRIETMVWGVDAPTFSMDLGSARVEDGLTGDDHGFFARRALLNLKRGLTVDMTQDTLRILNGSFGDVCRSSLALYGQRDETCVISRMKGWGGAAHAIPLRLQEFGDGEGPTPPSTPALDASVGKLCRGSMRLRLYINPTHALTMDVLHWRGKWDAMQAWQRGLVQFVERHRAAGCDVRLYDFSGFNSVTTDPIPLVSGRAEMRYYWEVSHYRDNVGRLILARLFGGDLVPPADFGVELTKANIDAHHAAMRAARDRYHVEHAEETAYVQKILNGPRIPH